MWLTSDIPNCRIPISNATRPEMKVKRTAWSKVTWARDNVSRVRIATNAVGPTGTSFEDPNIVYKNGAMNDEYKPFCRVSFLLLYFTVYPEKISYINTLI